MTISQAIIADFRAESELTRRLLEVVPADQFDWKPHEKSMSLRQLAGHIAETPSWADSMMEDEFDFATIDYKPFLPETHAELLESCGKWSDSLCQLLEGRDDDFMQRNWVMRAGDNVMLDEPRHQALRSFMIHHVAHHRGQLTVYLRLLGVPVPGTYGPTADDAS